MSTFFGIAFAALSYYLKTAKKKRQALVFWVLMLVLLHCGQCGFVTCRCWSQWLICLLMSNVINRVTFKRILSQQGWKNIMKAQSRANRKLWKIRKYKAFSSFQLKTPVRISSTVSALFTTGSLRRSKLISCGYWLWKRSRSTFFKATGKTTYNYQQCGKGGKFVHIPLGAEKRYTPVALVMNR